MDIDHKTEKEEQLERRKKVIFDMLNDKQYVPMKLKEMAMLLQIPKENRSELKAVLDALILEGKAEVTSKGKYRRATAKTVTGIFTAHPRGFGFVEVEGREEDVFIAEENVGGALHQDTVQVLLLPASTGKRQGGAHSANSGARHSRSDRHVSEEPDLWVCSAGQPADYDGYFCPAGAQHGRGAGTQSACGADLLWR